MGIFSGLISYQDINVNGLWKSQFFSATSITSTTFYGGSISSLYIGSGFTTNQEYKYVSGLTSDTQTQINSKRAKSEPFITSGSSADLTNFKQISGSSITLSATNNNLVLSSPIRDLVVSSILVSSINTYENNFSPSGWSTNVKLKSTLITFSMPTTTSIISGLVGGFSGRVVIFFNNTTGLIIFENDSTKTISNNKFKFSDGEGYFLTPERFLTLIYDGVSNCWRNMYPIEKKSKYFRYNDFYNVKTLKAYSDMWTGISDFPHQTNSAPVKIVESLDSPHTLLFSTKGASPLIPNNFVQLRPSRNESLSTTLMIGKVSMNSQASTSIYNTTTQYFFFGLSNAQDGNRGETYKYTYHKLSWTIPANGLYPGKWNIYVSPTFYSTSLNLSESVGKWVYLIIYSKGTYSSFLYSFDNKEYVFEATFTIAGAANAPNVSGVFSAVTSTEEFYLDNIGYII
jgi:hypothetical protein